LFVGFRVAELTDANVDAKKLMVDRVYQDRDLPRGAALRWISMLPAASALRLTLPRVSGKALAAGAGLIEANPFGMEIAPQFRFRKRQDPVRESNPAGWCKHHRRAN
jgi:hypothetical protein